MTFAPMHALYHQFVLVIILINCINEISVDSVSLVADRLRKRKTYFPSLQFLPFRSPFPSGLTQQTQVPFCGRFQLCYTMTDGSKMPMSNMVKEITMIIPELKIHLHV